MTLDALEFRVRPEKPPLAVPEFADLASPSRLRVGEPQPTSRTPIIMAARPTRHSLPVTVRLRESFEAWQRPPRLQFILPPHHFACFSHHPGAPYLRVPSHSGRMPGRYFRIRMQCRSVGLPGRYCGPAGVLGLGSVECHGNVSLAPAPGHARRKRGVGSTTPRRVLDANEAGLVVGSTVLQHKGCSACPGVESAAQLVCCQTVARVHCLLSGGRAVFSDGSGCDSCEQPLQLVRYAAAHAVR